MHSSFDNSGRKPPLSQSTQQPSSFDNYDIGPPPATATAMSMELNDIAIVKAIPNTQGEIDEIACIMLSGGTGHLRESQSFSVNFAEHESFGGQADYIHSSLHGITWIVGDLDAEHHSQQIIDNSFKRLGRSPPSPSQVIDATQIFRERDIRRSILSGSVNARIRCNDLYSTLQRLAMMDLLSQFNAPITGVLPTQTMAPVMAANLDTNYDAAPQHEALTESAQWNDTTTDSNFEPTNYHDAAPLKNDYAANVQGVAVGADPNYADPRYDTAHDVQPPDGGQPVAAMDAEPPMMTDPNDVHDLQQQQQQQPPPQTLYDAEINGGAAGGHSGYLQDLPAPNDPVPSPPGNAPEDATKLSLSPQQQMMDSEFAQQPQSEDVPLSQQQQQQQPQQYHGPEAPHNGVLGVSDEANVSHSAEAAMPPRDDHDRRLSAHCAVRR